MSAKVQDDLFALDSVADPSSDRTERAPTLVGSSSGPPGTPPSNLGQLGDFVLMRELGEGGLAKVYLAHQLSLDRKVALKVSHVPSRGEGQILAGLEHDHIVKVFTEFHDPVTNQHGLVLQYIPGTNLSKVLETLFRGNKVPQHGTDILGVIDALAKEEVDFDPGALRDREVFQRGDYVATVCRLGSRLAEALAFAHGRGILHCDIKPANILLTPYGRPLLVDFNVAVPSGGSEGASTFGGTMRYMAPEQLARFVRDVDETASPIDYRADLYGLGLVLTELLLGRIPSLPTTPEGRIDTKALLASKRGMPEDLLEGEQSKLPPQVWRVLRRCLHPKGTERYASGAELAGALRQAADRYEAEHRLPPAGPLCRLALRMPVLTLLMLTLVPHLVGTVVNIAYNSTQIPLSKPQRDFFVGIILYYNLVAYPICLALGWLVLRPIYEASKRISEWPTWPVVDLNRVRQKTLNLGKWAVAFALVGWLPGGVFFPLCVHVAVGSVGWDIFGHFLLSFTLSGLIALIYSYLGVQFVVLRSLYPRLMHAEQLPGETEMELQPILRTLGIFQFLAALVPLVGAIFLVALAPQEFTLIVRLLVAGLIGAGLLGLGAAVLVTGYLRNIAGVLMGRSERHPISFTGFRVGSMSETSTNPAKSTKRPLL